MAGNICGANIFITCVNTCNRQTREFGNIFNTLKPIQMGSILQVLSSNVFFREKIFFILIQIWLKFVPQRSTVNKGSIVNKSALIQEIAWHWSASYDHWYMINTLRPRRNEPHFADDNFKRNFFNENVRISIKISLKFVPKGPINNIQHWFR